MTEKGLPSAFAAAPPDASAVPGRGAAFHAILLCLSFAMLFAEGYDMQVLAYAAPLIIRDLSIDRGVLGPVFGAGLFGYMIGATVLTGFADRFGHKRLVVIGTAWFGLFTLIMAYVDEVQSLLVLRGAAGLGLGVAIPSVMALNSELSPPRSRSKRLTGLFVGYSLGASLGGALAAPLMERFGWQAAFYIGGLLPLALAPLLLFFLPESPRFRRREAAEAPAKASLPVLTLLSGRYLALTVLLWSAFIASLLGHHLMTAWLPTILEADGIGFQQAVVIGSMLMGGSIFGGPLVGALLDRFGPKALAVVYLVSAPLVAAIGLATLGPLGLGVLVFLSGAALLGAQFGLNAMAAQLYPGEVRSSGAGWALGVGRIGAILGPVVGGLMLSAGVSNATVFLFAAAPALVCAVLVYIISTMKSHNLQKLSV